MGRFEKGRTTNLDSVLAWPLGAMVARWASIAQRIPKGCRFEPCSGHVANVLCFCTQQQTILQQELAVVNAFARSQPVGYYNEETPTIDTQQRYEVLVRPELPRGLQLLDLFLVLFPLPLQLD